MEPFAFSLWLPVEPLAKSLEGGPRLIRGWASTDDEDLQREVIVQEGIDYRPLLETGYIDWDHRGSYGPEYLIGEPLQCSLRDTPRGGQGLWLEGVLYAGHPKADAAWELLLRSARGESTRRLGFSVQGAVLQRQGKFIRRSVVRHVALTHQPVNTQTFAELAKALAAPPPPAPCGACGEALLRHLVVCRGLSGREAARWVRALEATLERGGHSRAVTGGWS